MKNNGLVKVGEQITYYSKPATEPAKIVDSEYWPLYSWLDMLIKPWGETTISRIALLVGSLTLLLIGILIGMHT